MYALLSTNIPLWSSLSPCSQQKTIPVRCALLLQAAVSSMSVGISITYTVTPGAYHLSHSRLRPRANVQTNPPILSYLLRYFSYRGWYTRSAFPGYARHNVGLALLDPHVGFLKNKLCTCLAGSVFSLARLFLLDQLETRSNETYNVSIVCFFLKELWWKLLQGLSSSELTNLPFDRDSTTARTTAIVWAQFWQLVGQGSVLGLALLL